MVIVVLGDVGHALTLEFGDTLGMENELFKGIAYTLAGGLYVNDGAQSGFVDDVVILRLATTNTDDSLGPGQ